MPSNWLHRYGKDKKDIAKARRVREMRLLDAMMRVSDPARIPPPKVENRFHTVFYLPPKGFIAYSLMGQWCGRK